MDRLDNAQVRVQVQVPVQVLQVQVPVQVLQVRRL